MEVVKEAAASDRWISMVLIPLVATAAATTAAAVIATAAMALIPG